LLDSSAESDAADSTALMGAFTKSVGTACGAS
jgi:hypothetical protein